MVTHSSTLFDPLRVTQPALNRVIETLRPLDVPIVCFHDKNNPKNPPERYLYDDWHRLTLVSSDIGHFDFDMSAVRHVICMGGFFWCCERNTVVDTMRLWRRDAPNQDLRITQIVDGIFDMAEGVPEPVVEKVRQFQRDFVWSRHPKGSVSVEHTLSLIDDDTPAVEFLRDQLPDYPADVDVTIDYFGDLIPVVTADDASSNDNHESDRDNADDVVEDEAKTATEHPVRRPQLVLAFRMSHDLTPRWPFSKPLRPSRDNLMKLQQAKAVE